MRESSATSWLRCGSSIIFDHESLGPMIGDGSMVSLRTALSWKHNWPARPCNGGDTVLVSGLETVLDVCEPKDAEDYLRKVIKPFIMEFQYRWEPCGLVFGFVNGEKSFAVTTTDEEVEYKKRGNKRIRLSYAMWDGSSTLNVTRLIRKKGKSQVPIGYHVKRIS